MTFSFITTSYQSVRNFLSHRYQSNHNIENFFDYLRRNGQVINSHRFINMSGIFRFIFSSFNSLREVIESLVRLWHTNFMRNDILRFVDNPSVADMLLRDSTIGRRLQWSSNDNIYNARSLLQNQIISEINYSYLHGLLEYLGSQKNTTVCFVEKQTREHLFSENNEIESACEDISNTFKNLIQSINTEDFNSCIIEFNTAKKKYYDCGLNMKTYLIYSRRSTSSILGNYMVIKLREALNLSRDASIPSNIMKQVLKKSPAVSKRLDMSVLSSVYINHFNRLYEDKDTGSPAGRKSSFNTDPKHPACFYDHDIDSRIKNRVSIHRLERILSVSEYNTKLSLSLSELGEFCSDKSRDSIAYEESCVDPRTVIADISQRNLFIDIRYKLRSVYVENMIDSYRNIVSEHAESYKKYEGSISNSEVMKKEFNNFNKMCTRCLASSNFDEMSHISSCLIRRSYLFFAKLGTHRHKDTSKAIEFLIMRSIIKAYDEIIISPREGVSAGLRDIFKKFFLGKESRVSLLENIHAEYISSGCNQSKHALLSGVNLLGFSL